MATNDPFAEPDDSERTVIRPNPGGRRLAPVAPPPGIPGHAPASPQAAPIGYGVPQPAQPAPQAEARAGESPIQLAMTGMNRLNAAAATLFALISRIRNRAQHMEPDTLRRNVVAEVRAHELHEPIDHRVEIDEREGLARAHRSFAKRRPVNCQRCCG